jgi:hypothetical protein
MKLQIFSRFMHSQAMHLNYALLAGYFPNIQNCATVCACHTIMNFTTAYVMIYRHYVVTGPENTPYVGGQYHGKLVFSPEFPYKPPSIYMTTPNGR